MITKMMNGMGGTIQKKTNLKIWNEPHYITHAYNHHSSMFFCWMIQWWKWENFSIFFKFMRLNRQTTNNTKTTTINKNQCFETMSEHLFWLFIWKCQHHSTITLFQCQSSWLSFQLGRLYYVPSIIHLYFDYNYFLLKNSLMVYNHHHHVNEEGEEICIKIQFSMWIFPMMIKFLKTILSFHLHLHRYAVHIRHNGDDDN